MAYTPMMQQYLNIKEQYKDCILFFRLGDFYEMFFEDALVASKDMEVTLTQKACGEDEKAPMCGVPYHAADTYIARLIEKGHSVAICEQMEDPALAKGIVKRDVIRIITPGTVLSQTMLSEKDNNFLACVYMGENGAGLSYCDISTGEFFALQVSGPSFREQLFSQLIRIQPREIITNVTDESDEELYEQVSFMDNVVISSPAPELFSERNCSDRIKEHFSLSSEKGVGLDRLDAPLLFFSVGCILGYVRETQKQAVTHLRELTIQDMSSSMSLDRATIKNLELTETLFEHRTNGSLLGVLDRTGTAMGSRKMKQWLREPLNDKDAIERRLSAVDRLLCDILLRNDIREGLKGIYDLERLSSRISLGTANGRDLIALRTSLECIPDIKASLLAAGDGLLTSLADSIDSLEDMASTIEKAIVPEPPFTIREGGLIRDGYSEELDDIKASVKDGQLFIASLEGKERERTGIKNLKVSFNKVFGYYIEVSKSNYGLVPDNYIRKQTLVNCERYITPELKEVEGVVLNAQVKINELEYKLFTELRLKLRELIAVIQRTGIALAEVDVLCSFAESSAKLNYVRPSITEGDEIVIKKGRHPVIEQTIKDGVFVSNDIYIDRKSSSLLLITGPNMAGKSTYMRQLALIVLMAQVGCFVPAEAATIGICDRIYTRIGASDNIAQGQSTFFVEMSELAYILNTATEKSLVILDEIGRGTSTYDGLSIAWAVVEQLTKPSKRIRTLFATHYHELTNLENTIEGVRNLNVDVADINGSIVFLHKIVEGSASRSYGIHVAKLAGVPKDVLNSASVKLSVLEKDSRAVGDIGEMAEIAATDDVQLSLFSPRDNVLAERIRGLDIMNVTPSGAIKILEELIAMSKEQ